MAEFSVRAYISTITLEENKVKVVLNEYKKGYKTKTTEVQDRNIKWSVYFPKYFTKYIPNNFKEGNLVEVKAEIVKEKSKCLILGQTINLFSIRNIAEQLRLERRSKKYNQNETPDIENSIKDDFNF